MQNASLIPKLPDAGEHTVSATRRNTRRNKAQDGETFGLRVQTK